MHKPLLLGALLGLAVWHFDKQPMLIQTRLLAGEKPAANVRLVISEQSDPTEEQEKIIVTDDNGMFSVPEGSYIRLQEPVAGYYNLAQTAEIKEKQDIVLQPIQVFLQVEDHTEHQDFTDPVFILEDTEKKSETQLLARDGMLEIGSLLKPDQTYLLRQKEKKDNVTNFPDTEIHVDSSKPEKLEIVHRYEDTAVIDFLKMPGLSVTFFADEKGEQPVDAGDGLAKGTWYYRISMEDPAYYQDDTLHSIDVDPSAEDTIRLEVPLEKPELSVSVHGGQYHLWLENEQKEKVAEWDSDDQVHTIPVNRNSMYTLYSSPGSDSYSIQPVKINVPLYKEKDLRIALTGKPFSFAVSVRSQTTRQLLNKCDIRVENLSQHTETIVSAEPRALIKGLKEQDLLRLTPVNLPAGYISAGSTEVRVEKMESFDVMLDVIPYVLTGFQLPAGTQYQLFSNAECTIAAYDVNRQPLTGWEGIKLKDGTYYLKQMDCPLDQYPDEQVHPILIDSAKTSARTITIAPQPVMASLRVQDMSDSRYVEEAEVILKDEEGNTVYAGSPEDIQLERNKVYSLQLKGLPQGYTGGRSIRFRMPSRQPDTSVEALLHLQPYASVEVSVEDAGSGIAIALCQQNYLSRMAKDIHGQYARVRTDENGIARFQMPQGTYFIMMEQPGKYHYRRRRVHSVDAKARQNAKASFDLKQASLRVIQSDAQGKPVSGARMALLDLSGNKLLEWESTPEAEVIGQGVVSPGESYQIVELLAAQGFAPYTKPVLYTMSIDEPDQEETITIETKALRTAKEKQQESVPDMEQVVQEKKQNAGLKMTGVIAGIAGILIACKKFQ